MPERRAVRRAPRKCDGYLAGPSAGRHLGPLACEFSLAARSTTPRERNHLPDQGRRLPPVRVFVLEARLDRRCLQALVAQLQDATVPCHQFGATLTMPALVRAGQRAEPRPRLPELLVPKGSATRPAQPAPRRPRAVVAPPGAVLPRPLARVGPELSPALLARLRRRPSTRGEVARLGAELPIGVARLQREGPRAVRTGTVDPVARPAMLAGPRAVATAAPRDPRGDDLERAAAHDTLSALPSRSAPRAALPRAESSAPRPRPELLLAPALLARQYGQRLTERLAVATMGAELRLCPTPRRLEQLPTLGTRQGRRPIMLADGGEPARLAAELRLPEMANPRRLDREGRAAPSTGPLDGRSTAHVGAPARAVPILTRAQRAAAGCAGALDHHVAIIAQSVKFR